MAERFFVMPGRDASLEGETLTTRLALVIGNGAYPAGRLENPTNDAVLVGDTLRSLGFQVEVLLNAGKLTMERAIVAFGQRVERADQRAITFVYFAGHGLQDSGHNYLLPVEAHIPDRRYLEIEAIPVTFVVRQLGTRARSNIIVLDACRHALLYEAADSARHDQLRGLASINNLPDATLVAYSTAADTVAKDGEGKNSPFALAMARRLSEPDLKIHDVFGAVASDVAKATGQQQRPAYYLQGRLPEIILTRPDPPDDPEAEGSSPPLTPVDADRSTVMAVPAPVSPWQGLARWLTFRRPSGAVLGLGAVAVLAAAVGGLLMFRGPQSAPTPQTPGTDRFGLTPVDWCCTPTPWQQVVRAGRWAQVERAANNPNENDPAAWTLLAGAQMRGLEQDGRQIVRANIESARSLLSRAADRQHPLAQMLLAGLLDRGAGGLRRDRDRAREWYRAAAAGPDAEARNAASRALLEIDTETRLGIVHAEPLEFTREAPSASVQITVYLGFSCRGCGDFMRDILPQIRGRYLDAPERGPASENLRIIIRPYTRSKVEEDAAILVACADPRNRLAAAETLARHELVWSVRHPNFTERSRMEMLLKPHGLGRPRSDECFRNASLPPRLTRQSEEAHRLLAISEAPVVFVNGRRWYSPTIETLFEAIDDALPPDDRLSTWRR